MKRGGVEFNKMKSYAIKRAKSLEDTLICFVFTLTTSHSLSPIHTYILMYSY